MAPSAASTENSTSTATRTEQARM
uniref:Uncharacterized protein n=1 Tax=Arundo donax TaxID=35708 RepID=A0A0A9F119_ARUDO